MKNACLIPAGILALTSVGCWAAKSSVGADGATVPQDPVAFVREAVSRGAKTIVVPKATYEIDTKGPAYFDLKGLNGVVIDFQGGRLNGVRRTRMFNLSDSTNVVIRNVTIDYVRLPFAQGVIEKVDAEKDWDVRIQAGYPCPDDGELSRLTWPVQVYDAKTLELKNPMRYPDAKIVRTGPDTYRVTGGKDRRGEVGDYCVWSIRDADGQRDALNLSACAGCRIENVTVYSTPMGCGFNEADCASNVYRNCRLVRCPESEDAVRRAFRRLRSGNHDALNARRDYVGPTLDGCDFEYHCDDCVNISGFYSVVSRVAGNRIRILPYGGTLRIDVGDSCQILTADWKYPPDVRVVAIEPGGEATDEERKQVEKWNFTHGIGHSLKRAWWLTLDRPAGFDAGSCIVSNRRTGNGFKIVNSHFGSTRSRGLLIKASDGLIASNVIEKTTGRAISVTPEFRWLEGGCSTNLVIRDNVIRQESGIHLYDKRALQAAERRISVEEYRDKMKGAWIGQSVGVSYGFPTECRFCERLVPDERMPVWTPDTINETFNQDDLYVEMSFIRTLETRGLDVTCRDAGLDFANSRYRLWCANDKARDNLRRGIAAPDSSHPSLHGSPDDIDYQIEADFSGILSPGLPQSAIRLGETFGRIMNYGDGLWAGQFVGGLYAAAYFSQDRLSIVETALACIPAESRYAQMVRDMLDWYRADPKDWKGAWRKAVDKYGRKGLPMSGKVSSAMIDVKINGAMVLLGYLFGEGDPDRTMQIATRGGYDSDCNPSSACGVLFTSIGAKALPGCFTERLDKDRKWEFTDYTYPRLLAVCEKLTREIVVREGGRIETDADGKEWFVIPDRTPAPSPFWPTDRPGPVAGTRYGAAEMETIAYAPNGKEGRQSTRIRGADYTKVPGRVRVSWNGRSCPGWNDVLADWSLEGYSDIAARKPIREDDLFWVASNTKGLAAALVLTYVDEGKIALDDPVEKHFPEWKDIRVNDKAGRRAPKTKPTVRQVLSHTSGLSFFPQMPIDQYSVRELVTMAVEKGLDTDPGTSWRYSNWGIDVAVAVVEKVAGQPWETLLRKRILDPLRMRDTIFWPTTNQLARLVVPYHFPKDGGEPIRGKGVNQFRPDVTDRTRHAEAGGGLYSTAGDFLKFYVMVASRGVGANGRRILSEASCREWYRNQVPAELKKRYSFGMDVDPEKGTIGHGGAYATHAAANWNDRTCTVDFVQKCGKPANAP